MHSTAVYYMKKEDEPHLLNKIVLHKSKDFFLKAVSGRGLST